MSSGTPSNLQMDLVSADQLDSFQSQLEVFESHFHYPLEPGVTFQIDHGSRYAAFFERMGSSRLLIVRQKDEIIGMLACVEKEVTLRGNRLTALYFADLKVRPDHQGHRMVPDLYRMVQRELFPDYPDTKWELVYFVTMQEERGDIVTLSPSGSPLRTFQELGELIIYFVSPDQLASLPKNRSPEEDQVQEQMLFLTPPGLSPEQDEVLVDLSDQKELILDTTNEKLNVVHLVPGASGGRRFWQKLIHGAQKSRDKYDYCCFALDRRRSSFVQTLEEFGIQSESRAKVYALPTDLLTEFHYVSVGTFEI